MNGQSLKGRKLTLKPVNKETVAKTNNPMADSKNTAFDAVPAGSINVTVATRIPMKIRDTPSTIHSIVMMC